MQEDAAVFQISPPDEVADPAQEHGTLRVNKAPIIVGKESPAGDGSPKTSWQSASDSQRGISLILSYAKSQSLTAVAIRLRMLVGGIERDAGVRVNQQPKDLDQCALGRRVLTVEHQDGIRTDRPEYRRQPGDHQAKICVGDVNVGPEQGPSACRGWAWEAQKALGTPEVDKGPIDRAIPIANRDGPAAGITQVEEIRRARAVAVAAGANKHLGNVGVEFAPGLRARRPRGESPPGKEARACPTSSRGSASRGTPPT